MGLTLLTPRRSTQDYSIMIDDPKTIVHIRKLISSCTNIHSLTLNSCCYDKIRLTHFCALFSTSLTLPCLRSLNLQFSLDSAVFDFVSRHRYQLHELILVHVELPTSTAISYGEAICSLYPPSGSCSDTEITIRTHLEDCNPSSHRRSLTAPRCTYLTASPFLLPALLPYSNVTDVAIRWPLATDEDVDDLADLVVDALAGTHRQYGDGFEMTTVASAERGVKTVKYTSDAWNVCFMEKLAERMPETELVMLENAGTWFAGEGGHTFVSIFTLSP